MYFLTFFLLSSSQLNCWWLLCAVVAVKLLYVDLSLCDSLRILSDSAMTAWGDNYTSGIAPVMRHRHGGIHLLAQWPKIGR